MFHQRSLEFLQRKLLPRLGAFESLYYALDLNSESCHQEQVRFEPWGTAVAGKMVGWQGFWQVFGDDF
jgi:hypothetical protein